MDLDVNALHLTGWGVFFASIVVVLLPMALYETPHRKSLVFVGIPPMGNNTISGNTLFLDNRVDVFVMQLNGDFCAHFICVLVALEAILLWYKIRGIESDNSVRSMGSDMSAYTDSAILRHGGLYTANNEFWLFVAVHHLVLMMVVVSPVSMHALLLLVIVYIYLISVLCGPDKDLHEQDESISLEQRVNHVAVVCICGGLTFMLITIDQRLNDMTFESIGVGSGAFFVQVFSDLILVMVHASPQTGLLSCQLTRLIYVFTCGISVIWWMSC
jgi:hypothetical protein